MGRLPVRHHGNRTFDLTHDRKVRRPWMIKDIVTLVKKEKKGSRFKNMKSDRAFEKYKKVGRNSREQLKAKNGPRYVTVKSD